MDSIRNQIDELCQHLNEARNAYYNENREIMSNKEFDDAMQYLEHLEEVSGYHPSNSPVGRVGASIKSASVKKEVTHEIRAKSLDKTKDINELVTKLGGDDRSLVVGMWKLDGCTAILTYVNGDLVLAATRGDGEKGQDVTQNTKYIEGIPQHINMKSGKLIVRGECVISYNDFEEINKNLPEGTEPYANPRNLASASLGILNPEDMKDRHLAFQAFDFISVGGQFDFDDIFENEDSLIDEFAYLEDNKFGVVQHSIFRLDSIDEIINQFSKDVKTFEYPVDGLVFALDDRSSTRNLPGTEHHPDPKYGYAFKWADEEYETVLREIEWSPSRTGLLNPVAIFDPVVIDGTTVTRASLHNLSYIRDKHLVVGDHVTVYKANQVIPQIARNLSFTSDVVGRLIAIDKAVPRTCPTCGGETEIQTSDTTAVVCCTNPNCPEKLIGNLAHFCSKDGLDIDGWSEETIKKLIKLNVIKEFKDIFRLKDYPLIAMQPGFGKKSWEKLCTSAAEASHTTFVKFISALSIPGVGKGQAKVLKKYIDENYKELNAKLGVHNYIPFTTFIAMGLNNFDFTVINGIGSVMSTSITSWIKTNYNPEHASQYHRLLAYVSFIDKEPLSSDFMNRPTGVLANKSFCITGKLLHYANRQELVKKIEANGGRWVDSVSSKTDYLINNDVTSTSGKNKKARELNIPIISEEDFMKMLV